LLTFSFLNSFGSNLATITNTIALLYSISHSFNIDRGGSNLEKIFAYFNFNKSLKSLKNLFYIWTLIYPNDKIGIDIPNKTILKATKLCIKMKISNIKYSLK
jgi:hypothetical protein